MNYLIFHLVSGKAFFSGAGLILLAGVMLWGGEKRWVRVIAWCLVLVGMALVVLSATPLPFWWYMLWFLLMISWVVMEGVTGQRRKKLVMGMRAAVMLSTVVAVVWEAGYWRKPELAGQNDGTIYVIGDSVSAGIGKEERTWPEILKDRHKATIVNLARAGATLESALGQAAQIYQEEAIVILEIGGNDLLSRAEVQEFEQDLEKLLGAVCGAGRTVVMLELPLLPFCNRYGMAQRKLAKEYSVFLIPKHYFAEVLKSPEATTDGIHLSSKGQEMMAKMIGGMIGPGG